MREKKIPIHSHDVAMLIVELFEDLLDSCDITVPALGDEEGERRDAEGAARLFGSRYSHLLDSVEDVVMRTLDYAGASYIPYVFSGTC